MTDIVAPSSEPSYIARLALKSAPFNLTAEPDVFYSVGQAGHRLNLLLHLIRSSNKVANLIAEKGLGKSTLLQQFVQRTGDEIRLCVIDAEEAADINVILGQCLVDFGVSQQDVMSASDPLKVFEQRLQQLRQLHITPVLLIDNASLLTSDIRGAIAQWLGWVDDKDYLLQAVLFSDVAFQFEAATDERIQAVSLPPLSENELSSYLRYRLQQRGFKGDMPFTDKDMKRFYQQSGGVPLAVNQLAHQQLLGIRREMSFWQSLLQQVMKRIGLIIIVVSLLLLLLMQDNINRWLQSESSGATQDIDDVPIIVADEEMPVVVTDEQAQRDELSQLLSELTDQETKSQAETAVEPIIELAAEQPPVLVEPGKKAKPNYHGKDWVVAQSDRAYTFQMMGSWDRQEVYDFIEQYSLTGDVAVFESMRNGQVWHVLLYGSYESKRIAIEQSQAWPAPLNNLPSWLRRFDSVHIQIKNKAVIE